MRNIDDFLNNTSLLEKLDVMYYVRNGEHPKAKAQAVVQEIDNLLEKGEYFLIQLLLNNYGVDIRDVIDVFPVRLINPIKLEESVNHSFRVYVDKNYQGYYTEAGKRFRKFLEVLVCLL